MSRSSTMYTRKQYMNHEVSHEDYYGQFVTPAVRALVARHIGIERILASKDQHFNDIPLKEWDALNGAIRLLVGGSIAKANASMYANPSNRAGVSLSDTVCVAKAAARMIRDMYAAQ